MKKLLILILLFFSSRCGYSQAYIPMPADSAVWRYRLYDADYQIQVIDGILYVNGTDTEAHGNIYHKVFSRVHNSFISIDSALPPVTNVYASYPDTYFGAVRESGRKVFMLTIAAEELIFDFNAAVGDSIPSSAGNDVVVAIDSILLAGTYHRRFLTNDSTYSVIEGVGSTRGLIPPFIDGSPNEQFLCFTDAPVLYAPDTAIPCTEVYPIGYELGVNNAGNENPLITVFPVPAYDMLHIISSGSETLCIAVFNSLGQQVWEGYINGVAEIPVAAWAKGFYYVQFNGSKTGTVTKKLLVE